MSSGCPPVDDLEKDWNETFARIQAEADRRFIGQIVTWTTYKRGHNTGARRVPTEHKGVVQKVSVWTGRVQVFVAEYRKDRRGFLTQEERYLYPSNYEFIGAIHFDDDGED